MNPGVIGPMAGTFIFSRGMETFPSTMSPPHFGQDFGWTSLNQDTSRYPLDSFATTE